MKWCCALALAACYQPARLAGDGGGGQPGEAAIDAPAPDAPLDAPITPMCQGRLWTGFDGNDPTSEDNSPKDLHPDWAPLAGYSFSQFNGSTWHPTSSSGLTINPVDNQTPTEIHASFTATPVASAGSGTGPAVKIDVSLGAESAAVLFTVFVDAQGDEDIRLVDLHGSALVDVSGPTIGFTDYDLAVVVTGGAVQVALSSSTGLSAGGPLATVALPTTTDVDLDANTAAQVKNVSIRICP